MIKENAANGLRNLGKMKTFRFETPVEVVVRYTNARMADAVRFMPSAERLDGKSIRFVQDDFIKAFGALRASISIAGSVA
jgi:D-aminopeptidase